MRLNNDFAVRVAVHGDSLPWVPSLVPGVDRRMLFRIGEEKARATSIVRYAPNSRFSPHRHGGGEEFLVLVGTFLDENGNYPAGSYVRNPPGTTHTPGSVTGCTIFVRLWQFRRADRVSVVRSLVEADRALARTVGRSQTILFDDRYERVVLESWPATSSIQVANPNGLELLVLSGSFSDGIEAFTCHSWLRLPAGVDLNAETGADGARVWLRTGPLMHADLCQI